MRPLGPRRELRGWESSERRHADGAVDSAQRVRIAAPAAEPSADGARVLGAGYWRAVRGASGGLVRPRERDGAVDVLLLGLRPPLLRLAATAEPEPACGRVACSYAIAGGVLARRAGGTLALVHERHELRVVVEGFVPRVRALWLLMQRRFHVAVSRRWFRERLAEEVP
jgi:hypothetical protein